jgi:TonB family protein
MTYFRSIIWWDEIHKRHERIGFISSLCVHTLLFFIGGAIFVKTAQYNVQSLLQSTTVELVEAIQPPPVKEHAAPSKTIKKPVEVRKRKIAKIQKISSQVIKTQADPNYFKNPPPEYPELARQMRQEGLVMLVADIDREGYPIKVEIGKSSGYLLLDQAALKAVIHWRFQAGRIGDLAVESKVTVPVRFRLEE